MLCVPRKKSGIVNDKQKKNLQSLDFPEPFQPKLPIVGAKSDLCLAVIVCTQKKYQSGRGKTLDLELQTWATYSSYVGQVHVGVRVKDRVNKKKSKISTY
jgi:hypothetical protein